MASQVEISCFLDRARAHVKSSVLAVHAKLYGVTSENDECHDTSNQGTRDVQEVNRFVLDCVPFTSCLSRRSFPRGACDGYLLDLGRPEPESHPRSSRTFRHWSIGRCATSFPQTTLNGLLHPHRRRHPCPPPNQTATMLIKAPGTTLAFGMLGYKGHSRMRNRYRVEW